MVIHIQFIKTYIICNAWQDTAQLFIVQAVVPFTIGINIFLTPFSNNCIWVFFYGSLSKRNSNLMEVFYYLRTSRGSYLGYKTHWHMYLLMKCILMLLPSIKCFPYKPIVWAAAHGSPALSFPPTLFSLLGLRVWEEWRRASHWCLALSNGSPIDWGCVFISYAWYLTRADRHTAWRSVWLCWLCGIPIDSVQTFTQGPEGSNWGGLWCLKTHTCRYVETLGPTHLSQINVNTYLNISMRE